jgi:hypothetical protein
MASHAGLNGLTCPRANRALDKEKPWQPAPGPTACRERNSSTRTCEALGSSGLTYLGVVMRGVDAVGADIDAPWLFDGESFLRVNGVDVIPLVEAELNRRFPGRADRRAGDPDGVCAAWATLERTGAPTLELLSTRWSTRMQ